MRLSLLSYLSMAFSAIATATPLQSTDFIKSSKTPSQSSQSNQPSTSSLTIPDFCRKAPGDLNCPAKLPSGNVLLTARYIMVTERPNSGTVPSEFQVGWHSNFAGSTTEEVTIALFDIPSSISGRRCRFQFISDPENDEVSRIPAAAFNIWKLGPSKVSWDQKVTWGNKPARQHVLAMFVTDKELVNYSLNGKWLHKFYYGPGYRTRRVSVEDTFECPKPGMVAYEVASAIRMTGEESTSKIMVRGARSGLGIEVVGLKSGW
ncbi:hypothetical protein BZA77DRAFT_323346 [Pyronema omphalodes]|nr:hypothetical protein BZA77DRAFT_323346 [Pyronema omphalodes]